MRAPVFLLLKLFLVANFAGADTQVAHTSHEVEADFGGGVAGDAALEDRDNFGGEFGGFACAVGDGSGLQAVEFVEGVVY